MKTSILPAAALSAMLAVSSTGQVAADAGDALVGGIIGGVIGGAIVNERNKTRRTTTTTKRVVVTPRYSAARAENREVQTALNYFGFPAGTPDGVLGRRSRTAVAQYQGTLGYPATGYLTDYEKTFLLSSYNRAIVGGPVTNQQIASVGTRGLLLQYRDQAAGVAVQPAPGTTVVVNPAPQPAPQPEPEVVAAAPVIEEAPTNALPNFLGGGSAVSLASHCNKVSLLTNANGGFTQLASMTDTNMVLNEQLCLARTYAIATGEDLAASVQGANPAQIADQCKSFGPIMKDHVAALSLKPSGEVLRGVSSFVLSTGMSPPQLAATSKICLSVGYRTDDMDVAVGSGLILVALGEQVYAEMMGHHLSQGFGTSKRADLANDWYGMALQALDAGQTAAFAPNQPDRVELIRAATTGGDQAGINTVPVSATGGGLPTFNVSD